MNFVVRRRWMHFVVGFDLITKRTCQITLTPLHVSRLVRNLVVPTHSEFDAGEVDIRFNVDHGFRDAVTLHVQFCLTLACCRNLEENYSSFQPELVTGNFNQKVQPLDFTKFDYCIAVISFIIPYVLISSYHAETSILSHKRVCVIVL